MKEKPEVYKGSYVDGKGKMKEVSKVARDLKLTASMWASTEKIIEEFFEQNPSQEISDVELKEGDRALESRNCRKIGQFIVELAFFHTHDTVISVLSSKYFCFHLLSVDYQYNW